MRKTGTIDSGEGRPVSIEDDEDELPLDQEEDREKFAVLDDDDDPSPGDRRRDPLRRPQ